MLPLGRRGDAADGHDCIGFPLDPVSQLQKTAQFLQHPPPPNLQNGNLLESVFPLEQRTRILRFAVR
jgi:hypothetical protein